MAAETPKSETEVPDWLTGIETDTAGAPPPDDAAITDAMQAEPVVPETPVVPADNSDVGPSIAAQLKARMGGNVLERLKSLGRPETPPPAPTDSVSA